MKKSSQQRSVEAYRSRMRKAGLRLVQLWVPDTRAPGFAEECRRQSLLTSAEHEHEAKVLDWLEAATADLVGNET